MFIILMLSIILLYSVRVYDPKPPDVRLLEQAIELNREAIASFIEAEVFLEDAKLLNEESLERLRTVEDSLDNETKLQHCLLQLKLRNAGVV